MNKSGELNTQHKIRDYIIISHGISVSSRYEQQKHK